MNEYCFQCRLCIIFEKSCAGLLLFDDSKCQEKMCEGMIVTNRILHPMCLDCWEHYIEECRGLDSKQCKKLCPKEG